MKFGAQLSGQSVHEWRAHNILYNDLKLEIRNVTTKKPSAEDLRLLQKCFFDEYENFALVLKSKLGEIDFRIARCEELVAVLAQGQSPSGRSQFDREIQTLTRDLQNLSRYSQAQYRGFRKLLKKYHKWSNGGPALDEFAHQLYAEDSAARIDLTPRFLELSALWDMARDGKFEALGSLRGQITANSSGAAFDANMLAQHNVRRVWIPSDQVMQVMLTLLPHMRLEGTEETQISFLDNASFNYIRNSKQPGQLAQYAEDAWLCAPTGGLRRFTSASLSKNQTKQVLNNQRPLKLGGEESPATRMALEWIETTDSFCYATQRSTRTRYSLEKPAASDLDDPVRLWATVDENITLSSNKGEFKFPHAVIELRWRNSAPDLVEEVETSLSVWPVSDSFNLAALAALTLYPETFVGRPSWLKTLEENTDIRRVPAVTARRDSASNSARPSVANSRRPSASNSRRPSSSGTAPSGRLSSKPSAILLNQAPDLEEDIGDNQLSTSPQTLRYWNEFDYPDEEADFAVFVDAANYYDRAGVADKISQPIIQFSQNVRRTVRHIRSILAGGSVPSSPRSESSETDSLLPYSPRLAPQEASHYESFPARADPQTARRDLVMAALSCVCYVIAGVVTFCALSISASDNGSQGLPGSVRGVIVIGLLFGIAFSILANAIFNLQSSPSWLGQVVAQCWFFALVCTGAGGIAWVATT